MSLIQEALRRQREESEGGGTGARPPSAHPSQDASLPSMPPPMKAEARPGTAPPALPTTPAPPATETETDVREVALEAAPSRPWASVVGIALLVLLLAGGGLGLLFFAYRQWNAAKTSQRLVAGARTQSHQAAVPEPTTPEPAATTTPGPTTTPATDPAPVAPAPPPVRPVETDPVPATPATGAPDVPMVIWPYLKVTAVIGKGANGAAVINGRVVAVGELIEGTEVLSVGNYGVKLEYEKDTRFVKVGNTVE